MTEQAPSTSTPSPIIDVCGTVYDAVAWRANLMNFAAEGAGYLKAFAPALTAKAEVPIDAYERALAVSPQKAVELLLASPRMDIDALAYARELRDEGIVHQVLLGTQLAVEGGGTVNDRVIAIALQAPDTLQAWAGLSMADIPAALDELERCIALGAKGVSTVPFQAGVDPDSPSCHQLYGRLAELKLPLWIHTGMSFASNKPLHACTWNHIDRIAMAHPRLRIVSGHGGWPWIAEAMAVLQRQPNVYLEFSAHRPRHMAMAGSGWEPLFLYGRGIVRHKILFGSSAFVQRATVRELADEVRAIGMEDKVTNAWLCDNAARLLGLRLPMAKAA